MVYSILLTAWLATAAISTSPDPVSGAPAVRLQGFAAGTEVEVSFIRAAPDGLPPAFRSSARYRVAANGSVDVSSAPLSGDWKTSGSGAPFWSMQPDANVPVPAPDTILIKAQGKGMQAQTEYLLRQIAPVVVEPIEEFPGAFLARPTQATTRLPLIIVLGGSEGDDTTARRIAPQLAAHGYAALGLPYRSPDRGQGQAIPGLPSVFSEIPVDRLEQVYQWALSDARVDSTRIGLWGVSKGAEFALIAAANYDWLDAVAAIVPSDVVWEGFGSGNLERTGTPSFSMKGKPLPYVPYGAPGRRRNAKDMGRWQNPKAAAAARVPIERFQGLLLVAGGEQDRTWDSAGMSQAISERRAEHGLQTVSLIFPNAGHQLAGGLLTPVEAEERETVEGVGQARMAAWTATLGLFERAWPPGQSAK